MSDLIADGYCNIKNNVVVIPRDVKFNAVQELCQQLHIPPEEARRMVQHAAALMDGANVALWMAVLELGQEWARQGIIKGKT